MRRFQDKVWIPIVLIIVGIVLCSLALVRPLQNLRTNTLDTVTVSSSFEQREELFNNSIETLVVNASLFESLNIYFTQDDQVKVESFGDHQDYSTSMSNNKLVINGATDFCAQSLTIGICVTPKFKNVDIYLPESFSGSVEINGLVHNLNMDSEVSRNLEYFEINSLNTSMFIRNIESLFDINAMIVEMKTDNISGVISSNTFSSEIELENMSLGLKLKLEGFSNKLIVHEGDNAFAHNLRLSGFSNSLNNRKSGFSESQIGNINHNSSNSQLPSLIIDADGFTNDIVIAQ